jgi:hypothetical protein
MADEIYGTSEPAKPTIEDKYAFVLTGSEMGLEVLADILSWNRFLTSIPLNDPMAIAHHNLCLMLLTKCKMFDSNSEVIRAMLGLRKTVMKP